MTTLLIEFGWTRFPQRASIKLTDLGVIEA
jgi:hypothetical protein